MDTIRVVCGIIFKDDMIFLCRRSTHKSLGGFWEFPGGKIEAGEEEVESLSRELFEELGMRVDIQEHFTTVTHNYDLFTIELIAYICEFKDASFKLTDHDLYKWINKTDLMKWKLAPADIPIAEAIIKR